MTTTAAYRFAGRLLVLAAALCVLGGAIHPIVDGNAHSADSLRAAGSPLGQYLLLAGTVLLLAGLPLLLAHHAPRIGRLGFVAGTVYLLGNATCGLGHLVVEAMVAVPLAADPATAEIIPVDGSLFDSAGFQATQLVGGPVLLLGQILLGVAVLRGGLPRWIGVLLIVGGAFTFVPIPEIAVLPAFTFELPRGLGVAALAWLMLRDLATAAEPSLADPEPVPAA